MANTKTTALTENTAPLYTDQIEMVDDPGGTPLSQKIYLSNFLTQFPPNGTMFNGKLSVTVSASDLIVAIKTLAGTDPTTSNPVRVCINGTVRTISAATSITLVDATNWFGRGGVMFATIVQRYFAYAVWDSNSSIVAVSIGASPRFRLVSDSSATTTEFLHLGNYANFTATDDVAVIGAFDATLSATAAFTWTVPTFTNLNLIHEPIHESGWLTYVPTHTGFSVIPTGVYARYQVLRNGIEWLYGSTTNGTSNTTGFTISIPVTAKTATGAGWQVLVFANDNSAASQGRAWIDSGGTVATLYASISANTGWTASAGKRLAIMSILKYEY